jgi:hypothetical protein
MVLPLIGLMVADKATGGNFPLVGGLFGGGSSGGLLGGGFFDKMQYMSLSCSCFVMCLVIGGLALKFL